MPPGASSLSQNATEVPFGRGQPLQFGGALAGNVDRQHIWYLIAVSARGGPSKNFALIERGCAAEPVVDRDASIARTRCDPGWLFRPPIRRTTHVTSQISSSTFNEHSVSGADPASNEPHLVFPLRMAFGHSQGCSPRCRTCPCAAPGGGHLSRHRTCRRLAGLQGMRGFLAVPIMLLGVAVIAVAAAIDYVGDLLVRLSAVVAGEPGNSVSRMNDDDRDFHS
jgi:hypothetical protein